VPAQGLPGANLPPVPAEGPPGAGLPTATTEDPVIYESGSIENGGVSRVYYGLDIDAKEVYGEYTNSEESVANQQAFRNMEVEVPGAEVKKESGSPPPVPTPQGPLGESLPSATTKLPTGPPQPVPAQGLPGANLPPVPAEGPPGAGLPTATTEDPVIYDSGWIQYPYGLDKDAKKVFDTDTMSEEATSFVQYTNSEESVAKPQVFRNMEVVVPGAEVKKQQVSPTPMPTQGPWGVNQLFGGQNYLTRII